ncbi:hypothetical protein, partial [Mesorhizobium sp. M7A.F.Ca.CA.001.14.1.1]|uniref:hypothetical protein n=1 Tax=Mesorhizobium sp. M7A.F.Ca.CA.001.14.1.1 TaxID=2496706 RepID=UPI0019D4497B
LNSSRYREMRDFRQRRRDALGQPLTSAGINTFCPERFRCGQRGMILLSAATIRGVNRRGG